MDSLEQQDENRGIDRRTLLQAQACAGVLPARPMVVVGQPTAIDPSRAPDDKHILWLQVRTVPVEILSDAAGEIEATEWDHAKDRYADRVLRLLDEYAPGISDRVLARYVMSPVDLVRGNPNLVGGDHAGGSHQPAQLLFRPMPECNRCKDPDRGAIPLRRRHLARRRRDRGVGLLLGKRLTSSRLALVRPRRR